MLVADGVGSNELRADIGSAAAHVVAERTGWGDMPVPAVTLIEDALTMLAHTCDRHGLAPAETFRGALRRYRAQLEEGPQAKRIASGEHDTLEEVDAANHSRGRRAARHREAA